MAQPLLTKLRARLRGADPGGRIDVLAPPWVAPVLRRMPEIDEVIEADLRHGELQLRERWRLGRSLRSRAYDQAIVLPNSWKSALVPFFAGIPVRSGYAGEFRFGLLNSIYREYPDSEPAPKRYARLAAAPGNGAEELLPASGLRAVPNDSAAKFGVAGPYAVFCPGAEYGPAKRWPYFRELAQRTAIQTVLLGSANDLEISRAIEGKNLVGKTTLDEAIDLIAGAEYVVSNDSGLMHVAAASGTPQVALFGSSSPQRTPPLSGSARVLWLKPECSPCFQRECPLGHFRCMRELTVERVLEEIGKIGTGPIFSRK